jgi:hypothetical protein
MAKRAQEVITSGDETVPAPKAPKKKRRTLETQEINQNPVIKNKQRKERTPIADPSSDAEMESVDDQINKEQTPISNKPGQIINGQRAGQPEAEVVEAEKAKEVEGEPDSSDDEIEIHVGNEEDKDIGGTKFVLGAVRMREDAFQTVFDNMPEITYVQHALPFAHIMYDQTIRDKEAAIEALIGDMDTAVLIGSSWGEFRNTYKDIVKKAVGRCINKPAPDIIILGKKSPWIMMRMENKADAEKVLAQKVVFHRVHKLVITFRRPRRSPYRLKAFEIRGLTCQKDAKKLAGVLKDNLGTKVLKTKIITGSKY